MTFQVVDCSHFCTFVVSGEDAEESYSEDDGQCLAVDGVCMDNSNYCAGLEMKHYTLSTIFKLTIHDIGHTLGANVEDHPQDSVVKKLKLRKLYFLKFINTRTFSCLNTCRVS